MNKSTEKLLRDGDLTGITTYQAGAVQAAAHRILQKACDDALKPYGITTAQWLMIGTILDAGAVGIRITDLATKLGTTLPYLTNTLNLLQVRGIIARVSHEADSRAKLVTVNPDFVPKCGEIEQTLRQALRESVYAQVNPAEFRIYMKVLYQLSGVI